MVERKFMSLAEFVVCYGIGLTKTREEMDAERLKYHKLGRRRLISYADAEEWAAALRSSPKKK